MAKEMVEIAFRAPEGRRGWLIEEINGKPAIEDPSSQYLIEHGFASTAGGLQLRVPRRMVDSYVEKASFAQLPVSRAFKMSVWAKRELFSAMLTPVEKMGSTKRPASPTMSHLSPQIWFIA